MGPILWTLLITATGVLPMPGQPVQDRCDMIEVNHVHDYETGQPCFTQLIAWRFAGHQGEYRVIAWRLMKCDGMRPRRDFERGGWVAKWQDGETLREVRGDSFREWHTQVDLEMLDRDYLPKDRRRGLSKPMR